MLPSSVSEWLVGRGVSLETLQAEPRIEFALVRFDNDEARLADMDDPERHGAIMLPCHDGDYITDWLAWAPRVGKRGLLWGSGVLVGDIDHVFNPATYYNEGRLKIYETPLAWLQAEREGVVIVAPRMVYATLRTCRAIEADTARLATNLRRWLAAPKSQARISVKPLSVIKGGATITIAEETKGAA